MKLRERVRRKWPELWRNGWILHQYNVPAHSALSVKQFLSSRNITVLEHQPYSPDLAPCDFYLFPKVKSVLKGTHFVSVENVKAKTAEILNSLTGHDLRNCFEHWQHCMQLCVNAEGDYFEGDRSWFPEFVKQSYRHSLSFFLCVLDLVCTVYSILQSVLSQKISYSLSWEPQIPIQNIVSVHSKVQGL